MLTTHPTTRESPLVVVDVSLSRFHLLIIDRKPGRETSSTAKINVLLWVNLRSRRFLLTTTKTTINTILGSRAAKALMSSHFFLCLFPDYFKIPKTLWNICE